MSGSPVCPAEASCRWIGYTRTVHAPGWGGGSEMRESVWPGAHMHDAYLTRRSATHVPWDSEWVKACTRWALCTGVCTLHGHTQAVCVGEWEWQCIWLTNSSTGPAQERYSLINVSLRGREGYLKISNAWQQRDVHRTSDQHRLCSHGWLLCVCVGGGRGSSRKPSSLPLASPQEEVWAMWYRDHRWPTHSRPFGHI